MPIDNTMPSGAFDAEFMAALEKKVAEDLEEAKKNPNNPEDLRKEWAAWVRSYYFQIKGALAFLKIELSPDQEETIQFPNDVLFGTLANLSILSDDIADGLFHAYNPKEDGIIQDFVQQSCGNYAYEDSLEVLKEKVAADWGAGGQS